MINSFLWVPPGYVSGSVEFFNLFYIWSIGNGLEIFRDSYRKIAKISPGAYIFQRPFLRGLFLEGLIIGEAYCTEGNLRFKIDCRLAYSEREFYHFCFVLLCIGGQIPSTIPLGGLYPDGRFKGEFFPLRFWGAYSWRGLYMEGLIFGILR